MSDDERARSVLMGAVAKKRECISCMTGRAPRIKDGVSHCVNCGQEWRKCASCGWPISASGTICGECACEDDCAP